MEEEKKVRLSIVMDEKDHTYLKLCCVKLGVSLKDFVVNATLEKVDSEEDNWMESVYTARDEEPATRRPSFIGTEQLLNELGLGSVLHV